MKKPYFSFRQRLVGILFIITASYFFYLYIDEPTKPKWRYAEFTIEEFQKYYMKPEHALTLYQMMKDTHEILVKHNINYWIDSGTLLGAVRHHGLIHYDDDLDICIMHEDELRLQDILHEFADIGYKVNHHFIYHIMPKDTEYPILDIFICRRIDDKITYAHIAARHKFPNYFFYEEELFPLKMYDFGQIKVTGPNNPLPLLDRYYRDWDQYAVIWNQHAVGRPAGVEMTKVKLIKEFLVPAEPQEPLKNRVK
ncbi:LicD family protein [Candidatus Trichorickettsia mobilis]|uniref:LicD family protein n=1 Tax=Candidatus Trichorickettsia mobilis TaxID=1346319 RepID=UPI00292EEA78|nr:LicD family protein [Candidatus Trichorickettsia mobilis]